MSVAWTYPGLFHNDTSTLFPTYLDRLYSPATPPNLPFTFVLACASLTNNTSIPQSVDLTVALPSYATSNTKTVQVGANATLSDQCLDPVFDFSALDALTTLTPTSLQVSAAMSGGGQSLGADSHPLEIVESNGIDWTTQGSMTLADMGELTAVFVRPNDPTVTQVRSDAEKLSAFVGGFGTPPFQHTMAFSGWSVSAGGYQADQTFMETGEQLSVALTSVSGGTDNAVNYILFNSSQFSAWTNCGQCASSALVSMPGATSGTVSSYTATSDDWYYIVMQNPSSNLVSRTVTWERNSMNFDAAYDVAQATFLAVRNYGVTYSNIGSTDLTGTQDIRPPANVITNKSGNCIEGSLLFASVAENVGFDPQLNYLQLCSDGLAHAIYGVRVPGGKYFWQMETTDVGTSSVTPWDAMFNTSCTSGVPCIGGVVTINNHTTCDNAFDVATARQNGITPGQ